MPIVKIIIWCDHNDDSNHCTDNGNICSQWMASNVYDSFDTHKWNKIITKKEYTFALCEYNLYFTHDVRCFLQKLLKIRSFKQLNLGFVDFFSPVLNKPLLVFYT